MLVLAVRFELSELVQQISATAVSQFDASSVIFWLVAAQRSQLEDFKALCIRYMTEHQAEVKASGAFDRLAGGELGASATEALMEVVDILE